MRLLAPIGLALLLFLPRQDRPRDAFPDAIVKWQAAAENPVFTGAGGEAWDRKIRERGWMMYDGGRYRLWYTGYNDDRSPSKFLGHATSPDGVHWTRDKANPIYDKGWVEDVCVVKDGGTYLMFAEGEQDRAHLLTSPDGLHWTEQGRLDVRKVDGTPIPPGPYGTPTVFVENGTWYLFYERGDQGVWLATSKDRKVWTNLSDEPVLPMGPDAYDRAAVAVNQVIKRDGSYYAFYHANAARPWKDWTTCVARSRDLIHWEKFPGNPILTNNSSSGLLVDGPEGPLFFAMHPEVRLYRQPKSK
ncbi:MAG TPA: glycosylase [Isosphaeraceae bacterium]|jgi:sucrose-6-phosphate hydrolase SacC (GH32 family)|nr:glycosylase [Isosphaeraceae bacterium]